MSFHSFLPFTAVVPTVLKLPAHEAPVSELLAGHVWDTLVEAQKAAKQIKLRANASAATRDDIHLMKQYIGACMDKLTEIQTHLKFYTDPTRRIYWLGDDPRRSFLVYRCGADRALLEL
jgi:hypothetical protein